MKTLEFANATGSEIAELIQSDDFPELIVIIGDPKVDEDKVAYVTNMFNRKRIDTLLGAVSLDNALKDA
jgi:hypothetical protein